MSNHKCPFCDHITATPQARGSHIRSKHPEQHQTDLKRRAATRTSLWRKPFYIPAKGVR